MRWGACLVAALAMATVETANAQSVANTIAEFGLIGTWATDCTQPASSSNFLTVYAIKPSGEVSRTYYDQPGHVYNNYKITSAKRQAPDMLSYEQVWDFEGSPANIAGDRVQRSAEHGGQQISNRVVARQRRLVLCQRPQIPGLRRRESVAVPMPGKMSA